MDLDDIVLVPSPDRTIVVVPGCPYLPQWTLPQFLGETRRRQFSFTKAMAPGDSIVTFVFASNQSGLLSITNAEIVADEYGVAGRVVQFSVACPSLPDGQPNSAAIALGCQVKTAFELIDGIALLPVIAAPVTFPAQPSVAYTTPYAAII